METSMIDTYLMKGVRDKHWYAECESTLVEIFGQDQLWIVTRILAATSINTSLKGNITLFRRAYAEYLSGAEFSSYLPNIRKQLVSLREGGDLSGRKIRSFAQSMTGDENAVVVDVWILRAFKMNRTFLRAASNTVREGGASVKQYTVIEAWMREQAPKYGLKPREMCAMIWSGVRTMQGTETSTRYTDILRKDYLESMFKLEI